MPVGIPRVPLFRKDDKREKEKDRKDRRKGRLPGYFDLDKEDLESDNERDLESDNERDRESDYERDRAYSEFISRLEDDEDGGEEAVKEEDKEKEKEKEKEKRKEQAIPRVDLFTRMYKERVLFYFGELTHEEATKLIALIIYANIQDDRKKILLAINSPGGDLRAGVSLYDTVQHAHSGVNTLCVGSAFSTASLVLSGGEERAATANSRIMIRKPRIPLPILKTKRKWEDFYFESQLVQGLTLTLIQQLAKRTGKSEQTVKNDLKSPKFMSAEEAQIHGIIDHIVDKNTDKDLLAIQKK